MSERKRVTLEFRRGQPGLRFPFVSNYGGLVVGLCSNPQCSDNCRERLGPDFSGGLLEVDLEHRPPYGARLTEFYLAHFVNRIAPETLKPIFHFMGGGLAESDADGLTAMCYIDTRAGLSLLVDCGAPPDQISSYAETLNQLLATPGLSGLVITHGHTDHWNLCSGLQLPVFCEHLTALYIERQEEQSARQVEKEGGSAQTIFRRPTERRVFTTATPFEVGQFKICPIPTAHSIPDTSMFFIESPSGVRILHTGDFKFNGMNWRDKLLLELHLKKIGEQGVDIMYVDNLNAHNPGFTPEEGNAVRGVAEIIAHAQGRVVVTTFASNLERLGVLSRAALDFGRPILFTGNGMIFARELLFSRGEDLPVGGEPMEKTVIFTTGCQAEEWSVLYREILTGRPNLWLQRGDTVVFSSRVIPGNEAKVKDLVERLLRRGCEVVLHEGEIARLSLLPHERLREAFVHVSGHGQAEDVRLAVKLVRPKRVVPAVRISPQIEAFREIAESLGIEIVEAQDNRIFF